MEHERRDVTGNHKLYKLCDVCRALVLAVEKTELEYDSDVIQAMCSALSKQSKELMTKSTS
jgi:hypothetical protein